MAKSQLNEFQHSNRWFHHAIAAPIIAIVGTYLWANFYGDDEWLFWQNMSAIQAADFYGALAYPVLGALYESTMWIWRKGYKAGHKAGFAEQQSAAIKAGRSEGKDIALTVAWRLAGTDEQKNLVRWTASDLDINLPAVLGQSYVTAKLEVISPWDALGTRFADVSAELRQRVEINAFDSEFDKILRRAAAVAIADLEKQIEGVGT